MYERDRDRDRESDQLLQEPSAPRTSDNAVLALQRTIGNHETARVLARDAKSKNRPQYPNSVKFGKLAPIEIKGGNIDEWAAKKTPDGLVVVSRKGKHSGDLKRLFDSKGRVETMETSSVVGENTIVTITFENCRVTQYTLEDDTENWTVEFTGAKRQTLSIGSAR